MTRKEIATHLKREFNRTRIERKLKYLLPKLKRAGKTSFTLMQKVGNNTTFTVYLYRITKNGVIDYVAGVWFTNENGLCYVSVGDEKVNFYNQHLFERYAEHHLKNSSLSIKQSAQQFFEKYSIGVSYIRDEVAINIHETETHLNDGFMLGYSDFENAITVQNTFISTDMLKDAQLKRFAETEGLRDLLADKDNLFTWSPSPTGIVKF
jgi:hypothetical protein